jgi:c-di-GMP-binding flagellar brake protein YcgR
MIDRFLAVYDQDKTVFLGRVEDLSVGGMCVVSNEVPPAERHLRLALEVLREDGGADTFHLRCRVLWIRPEKDSELYRIGFAFSGNSPAVEDAIARLIQAQSLTGSLPTKPG